MLRVIFLSIRREPRMDEAEDSFETESDSSEEDGPPLLKYTRLGGNIVDVAKRDTTSCATVNDRILVRHSFFCFPDCRFRCWALIWELFISSICLATKFTGSWFMVALSYSCPLMHMANLLPVAQKMVTNPSSININILPGKVIISSLYENTSQTFNYSGPVFSVAISPEYTKTKEFACGLHSGQVILHSPGTVQFL